MSDGIQAVKGMNDILPEAIPYWNYIENILRTLTKSYGYKEIRTPLVEYTSLFKRTIGEVTDIVEKEMYTFSDKSGASLTLRPEGTASCVRAGIENSLFYNQAQRLWYLGPMFRHETQQKGRYRQFYQFGVEAFGLSGPDIDAELIFMLASLWRVLKINGELTLHINNIGTKEVRADYRNNLRVYFTKHIKLLDEDSRRRLSSNPLRILDSKNPEMQSLINDAPNLLDYLDDKSKIHFAELRRILDLANIDYVVNSRLVRGLDYYCQTVFEWITAYSGAQNAVCGGGRYDYLVEQLGWKQAIPACGFALGMERVIGLIANEKILTDKPDAYLIIVGNKAEQEGLLLAEKIRAAVPSLSLVTNCGGGNFKNQFKRADKSGANLALILGDEEVAQHKIALKYLREEQTQIVLSLEEMITLLQEYILHK